MDKIKKVIQANLADKSEMPDWYHKRLQICRSCPLNSKNFKPITLHERVRYSSLSTLNRGKDFCWECGCNLESKAYLPESECGDVVKRWKSIDKEPEIIDEEFLDYTITNASPDKVDVAFKRGEIEAKYKPLEYLEDSNITIILTPKTENDFINIRVSSECGCTTMDPVREGKSIILNISYDTKRIGEFKKLITMDYSLDKKGQVRVRIKGEVDDEL
jgi:hypothetical protein